MSPFEEVANFAPAAYQQPIIVLQTPFTRALNLGFLEGDGRGLKFVPGRLNLGYQRGQDTYEGILESLRLLEVFEILLRHGPENISTLTILREALACRLPEALEEIGIEGHHGDAFIGAKLVKSRQRRDADPELVEWVKGQRIKASYYYENLEGLKNGGLWIIADSICKGRTLTLVMERLLSRYHPSEILFIGPIASRIGINAVGEVIAKHAIPTTFVAWGALFGVDGKTQYDMPWGHRDTEVLDMRDRDLFVSIYGPDFCMGGDFGNNYFCPSLARRYYEEKLRAQNITPRIPSAEKILQIYTPSEEILIREV